MPEPKKEAPLLIYRETDLVVDREELERRRAARRDVQLAPITGDATSSITAAINAAPSDPDDDGDDDSTLPIPVAISSERAVYRDDWWTGESYNEILDHSASSVDLSYARDGMPFLTSHESWDANAQHGLLENVRVGDDKVLRADLRMSQAPRSQEIRQDILDGIRKKVSVGYIRGEDYTQTTPDGDPNGIPTRRYTAWMPVEGSVVPIPADYSVGFGRDGAAPPSRLQDARSRFLRAHPSQSRTTTTTASAAKELEMSASTAAAAVAAATAATEPNVEAQRSRDIAEMAEAHGLTERINGWLKSDKTTLQVSREISDILKERMKKGVQTVSTVDVPGSEVREYSFARALIGQDAKLEREAGIDCGYEREIAQAMRATMPEASPRQGAMVLPMFEPGVTRAMRAERAEYARLARLERLERVLLGRAGIDSGTASTGGAFKFTAAGDFIELLRNRLVLGRAGATFISGLTGPVTFPAQLAAGSGSWIGENPGSDTSDTNLTMTTVSLAFKTLMSTTSVSRQALFSAASGNYDLEAIIRADLAAVIALAVDLAGINGLGSSNQPKGVLQNTSIGSVTIGANGGTAAWGNIVDLETAIATANADQLGGLGYVSNPAQRGKLKKKAVLDNSAAGITVWQGGIEGQLNSYPAFASQQVPANLTKGTSTTVCSAIIFGAWSQLLIGQFGNGFEVLTDPYRLKKQGMIELTAYTFIDVALRYAAAFAAIQDAT
jgi:HK97 family phage major capsid protein